jgi:class 3 adenylate cyclase
MCLGMLQRKRPTALGQADYYGAVANTAARVMALTQPGQIWIEGHLPFDTRHRRVFDVPHTLEVDLVARAAPGVGTIRLEPRGHFAMKGLPKPAPIFEVRR